MKLIKLNKRPTQRNRLKNHFALVDDDIYEFINKWNWHSIKAGNTFYAFTQMIINNKKKRIQMHRFIVGLTPDDKLKLVDHKDRDGLNNQRCNLRICNQAENCRNNAGNVHKRKSKYKGISYDIESQRWFAIIVKNKERIFLGRHKTEIQAAKAYNEGAKKTFWFILFSKRTP